MSDEPSLISTIGEFSLFARAEDEVDTSTQRPDEPDHMLTMRLPESLVRGDLRYCAANITNYAWLGCKGGDNVFRHDEKALSALSKLLLEAADRASSHKPAGLLVRVNHGAACKSGSIMVQVCEEYKKRET
jgi:hypothetical protein